MKPEEQRIALAEWAGNVELDYETQARILYGRQGSRGALVTIPDYLNDLNAVHLLEMKLTFEQAEQFEDELCDIVVKYNEQLENPAPWRFAVAHATAAQRCKALLKTLNLWKP